MNQIIIHLHANYLDQTRTDLHETRAFPVISSINCCPVISSINCSGRLGKLLKSICCSTFCHYKFKFEGTVKAYMLRLGLAYIAIAVSGSISIVLQINELSISTTKQSSFNSNILIIKQSSNVAQ